MFGSDNAIPEASKYTMHGICLSCDFSLENSHGRDLPTERIWNSSFIIGSEFCRKVGYSMESGKRGREDFRLQQPGINLVSELCLRASYSCARAIFGALR
jgi:hypothetical protein